MAIIIVRLPDSEEVEYELGIGVTNVGRHSDNLLQIEHESVSNRHAAFVRNFDSVLLKDLSSLNGTYVNGSRIQETWLKAGDGVRFGDVECTFTLSGKANGTAKDLKPRERPADSEALETFRAADADLTEKPARRLLVEFGKSKFEAELKDNPRYLIGRGSAANLSLNDPSISWSHCRLGISEEGVEIQDLDSRFGTFVNGKAITTTVQLRHGDRITLGDTTLVFLDSEFASAPTSDRIHGAPYLDDPEVTMIVSQKDKRPKDPAVEVSARIPLSNRMVLGRDSRCEVPLPSRDISRFHAEISEIDGRYFVRDLNSTNGTFINDQALKARAKLGERDRLRVGPYTFLVKDGYLWPSSQKGNARISVQEVSRTVKDRGTRRPLKLLDDISLVIEPNEFVALLGPSGSGKSTLMDAMNGRRAASAGRVMINTDDLYSAFRYYRRAIGYVPQQDIVHLDLTVEQALRYTARLRLPSDTTAEEIEAIVDEIIKKLGLAERSTTVVRNLSGGQLKRVSLGVELIADPSLLFLDEATSGLDAGTEEKMMALFRKVADGGRTVVCITHNVENVGTCDLVAVLVRGRLAYYGPPAELPGYFGVGKISEIYDSLEGQSAEEWGRRFEASELRRRYVTERMKWLDHTDAAAPIDTGESASPVEQRKELWRQFKVLTTRYATVVMRDRKNVAILLAQAPIIAVLVGMVFQNDANATLVEKFGAHRLVQFLMVISAVWFGCTNAAKEIVKELPIYLRERAVSLHVRPYLASKFVVLSLLCAGQCGLLLWIVAGMTGLEGGFAAQFGILFMTSLTSVMMGLMVSAAVDNADKAMALTPILLIPQVIFAGVIKDLTGATGILARIFIVAYWACDAMRHSLREALPSSAGAKYSLAIDLSALGLFLAATMVGAIFLLRRKDRLR